MKTIAELDRLEKLAFDHNLKGDALLAKFEETKFAEVKPLYNKSMSGRLMAWLEEMWEELSYNEMTGRGHKLTFTEFYGEDWLKKVFPLGS